MLGRCVVMSATLRGVRALPVSVEVSVSGGMPGMFIVGMPDVAVQEARERVRAAVKASGFSMPQERIVVNLAPGDVRKSGSGFDLPIALGVLVASGQVNPAVAGGKLFVGELSLEGAVRPVSGTLAYGVCALEQGVSLACGVGSARVPREGFQQLHLSDLSCLRRVPAAGEELDEVVFSVAEGDFSDCASSCAGELDYSDVCGHEVAKRAFQIAAAGGHGVLMMGPPGSGKTMLASRLPSILPPLDQDEALEAAVVHSVAGEAVEGLLRGLRPFRSPHHSATLAGLVGGGSPVRPGEISLAHKGVLFLDELPEFKVSVLQGIRQPVESGKIVVTRADGNVTLPAEFMLVAAANPCPCGYYGDVEHPCNCTAAQIRQYQGRIGGPLLDRIDLHLDVRRAAPEQLVRSGGGASSAQLREGVMLAQEFASWRRSQTEDAGASRKPRANPEAYAMSEEGVSFLEQMARLHHLSGRAIARAMGVSRTIADIDQSRRVEACHVAEAIGFKIREGVGAL